MSNKVYLLVLIFSIVQIKSTLLKNHRNLADEAREQLEQLKNIVQGNILVAYDDLATAENDFLTNSEQVQLGGTIAIQQHEESVQEQLDAIRGLAQAANTDISSCTEVPEEMLNRWSYEYIIQLGDCVVDENGQASGLVSDGKYMVDVSINKVYNLDFQLNQCEEDLLCISPLLTEIELDKIRLPEYIKLEVTNIDNLLKTLQISVKECSDVNVSQYTVQTTIALMAITDCANRIIG